jgi:hypothetical protein
MGRWPPIQPTQLERQFEASLRQQGDKNAETVARYMQIIRRFRRQIGEQPLNRVSEAEVRNFFAREFAGKRGMRRLASVAISEFLRFAAARLPVVEKAKGRGFTAPVPAACDEREVTLRRQWEADKLEAKREAAEDITVKLVRQVIEAYRYFQQRLNDRDSPESIDELMRLQDNCQELIKSNLELFLSLSAQGKNLHPAIDERVKR